MRWKDGFTRQTAAHAQDRQPASEAAGDPASFGLVARNEAADDGGRQHQQADQERVVQVGPEQEHGDKAEHGVAPAEVDRPVEEEQLEGEQELPPRLGRDEAGPAIPPRTTPRGLETAPRASDGADGRPPEARPRAADPQQEQHRQDPHQGVDRDQGPAPTCSATRRGDRVVRSIGVRSEAPLWTRAWLHSKSQGMFTQRCPPRCTRTGRSPAGPEPLGRDEPAGLELRPDRRMRDPVRRDDEDEQEHAQGHVDVVVGVPFGHAPRSRAPARVGRGLGVSSAAATEEAFSDSERAGVVQVRSSDRRSRWG